jgi:hypothetical protein
VLLDPAIVKNNKIILTPSSDYILNINFELGNSSVSISFKPDPDDNPAFLIKINSDVTPLHGEKLYVSSAGHLYLSNEFNAFIEKKLKYTISDGKLKEVRQPFYFIDMNCETSAPLLIYENKCNQGNLIARIPRKSFVRILAVENVPSNCRKNIIPDNKVGDSINSYLVSTPFGLVGWAVSSSGYLERPGNPLGCLRHNGN